VLRSIVVAVVVVVDLSFDGADNARAFATSLGASCPAYARSFSPGVAEKAISPIGAVCRRW
jgi:hypothetical protein